MKRILTTVIFCLVSLSSCDVSQDYSYVLTNSIAEPVSVYVEGSGSDTTFVISAGRTATIFIKTHYSTIKEKSEHSVHLDLDRCDVSRRGVVSSKNYLSNEAWTYKDGTYRSAVTDSEFPAE